VNVSPVSPNNSVLLFRADRRVDERGFLVRVFDTDVARANGIPGSFAQDSLSRSHRGVVRGLHPRQGQGEAKLVSCSRGPIFDVVVDLRPKSCTFRNRASFELRDSERACPFVPVGCAHGFRALTEPADVSIPIGRSYDPGQDRTIAFDEPEPAIPLPLPVTLIWQRDGLAPSFADSLALLA